MNLNPKIYLYTSIIILCLSSAAYTADRKDVLKTEIDRILSNKCAKEAKVGIKIIDINTGETLYDLNSDTLFTPASNIKLITTAAALKRLHPDYRFKTIISTDDRMVKEGVIKGNLYIKGFGDPKLVSEELWIIVKDLYSLGIRKITGDIVGDVTFFDKEEIGNGWGNNLSSHAYHAKIGALSLNFNSIAIHIEPAAAADSAPIVVTDPDTQYIDVQNKAVTAAKAENNSLIIDRVRIKNRDRIIVKGKISKSRKRKTYYRNISSPQRYMLTVFKEFMERQEIAVDGSLKISKQPEEVKELVKHESRPLAYIIRDLNKMSNNFIAEQIVKTMGAELKGEPGTTEKGLDIVRDFLSELGIPEKSYIITDGSGLSKLNRVTPGQITKILEYMYKDFIAGPEYVSSLGIIGVDGSVKDRLKGSSMQRKIRAKTGTLNGIICLSGYAETRSGDILVFSILMNNTLCGPNRIMKLQDKIILSILK